jgi:hypothetical protein
LNVGVGGFAKSGPPYARDGILGPSCLVNGSPFSFFGSGGQAGSGCINSPLGDTYLCVQALASGKVGVGGLAKSGPP